MTGINAHFTGDKAEVAARLSNASAVSKEQDLGSAYETVKTPERDAVIPTVVQEDGALRPGGNPELFSREFIGIPIQYAAVGLIYGVLPATIYPFIQAYLNAEGTVYLAAEALVTLPWSFKVFYGMLSDCVPIMGYRRRPYMIIGWTLCLVMLIIMAATPVEQPYFLDAADRDIKPEDYDKHPGIEGRLNKKAPDSAGKYIVLMMLAAVGYLMSDVCADSFMAELAQREPLATRGKAQSAIYTVRTVTQLVGILLTGFAFNGEDYGGDFSGSLTFPQLMIILACCLAPAIPCTWFFINEEKRERVNFKGYIKDLWRNIQTRVVYQILFYQFFSSFFSSFSYAASSPVQLYMVGVTPINQTISSALGKLTFMFGIMATSRWGLRWNWRTMTVVTGFMVILVDAIVTYISVWDVFRSQWFFLGPPIAVEIPYGIQFIISTYVTVELVEDGNEGVLYGMITTVYNLAQPFAATISRLVDAQLPATNEMIRNDTHDVRMNVTWQVTIMYLMTVVSWAFVVFLPRQKAETQELKRKGQTSFWIGVATLAYMVIALIWSIVTNLMGIFPETGCLVIAGGTGC